MLNVVLAIATAILGTDEPVRHRHVWRPRPDEPDWQPSRPASNVAIAAARRALDGVDHPLIL
jgi:hypothetical protein